MRLSAPAINKAQSVAVFAALLGLVVTLQVLGGVYASGFGGYPDEPAHLVTSLMVRDFLAGLDFRHLWQFPNGGDWCLAARVLCRSRHVVSNLWRFARLGPDIYHAHCCHNGHHYLLLGQAFN